MANPEHESGTEDGVYASAAVTAADRRSRRRRQAAAGILGLAVLGGGTYLVTQQLGSDHDTIAPQPDALAPLAATTGATTATPAATATSKPAATKKAAATPTPTPAKTLSAEERVKKARAAAAKAGFPVQRPLQPANEAAAAGATAPVTVTNSGSLAKGGTLRVVSSRSDLTGLREHAWAADKGRRVGDATCTDNFHFSNDSKAQVRPTMLLCWRTSAQRSVLTVAVTKSGRPASATSIAALDKEWTKLG